MAQFFIISPTAMENGVEAFVQQPIGSGPYKFVDWIPDDHVTVTANAEYWGGPPAFTDVTWRVLPEGSTRVAALQAEEIQVLVDLPSEQFEALNQGASRATEVRSVRTPYFRFFPESPQGGGEPFADIRVRQAVNHAVNVDSIITNLLGNHGERFPTIMTPDMFGFDPEVAGYEYDVERARALMEEAGYADGFEITMDTWSAGPAPKPVELAQAVAADLAQINIRATVNPVELGTALQNQNERTIAPFGLWSWGGNGFDGDSKFWGVFHTDSSACFLTDDETVGLIDQERDTTDPDERAAIFAQLQQHVVDQAFILPMFAMMNMYGVSTGVEWTPRPDELVLPYQMTPTQ
jgi:peptide/nickel transport system substrate-binding protein